MSRQEPSNSSAISSSPSPSTPGRLPLPPLNAVNSSPLPSPRHEIRQPHPGSPAISQRSSFVDHNKRGHAARSPSFSQQALQDLINNPPVDPQDRIDEKFAARDWRGIKVEEIIDPEETRFVEVDSSVEDATKLLISSGAPNVVLIREHKNTRTAVGAFDYNDLNAYLLFVTNLALPSEPAESEIENVMIRARKNQPISLKDIRYLLGRKEPPAFMEHTDTLSKAVEMLGGGIHRIIVRKQGTTEVVGILSQLRLVRFFWQNHRSFGNVEPLHSRSLSNLNMGSHDVISINGDKPLKEALLLMHFQGITSLAVLDNKKHVIGNISHVDVKHLTSTASLPLLDSSCIHFLSVILSERGMNDGKDSYPVFHVTHSSTLAHTVAKLVATRSHRMWIVDSEPSPGSSVPPSPGLKPSGSVAPPPTMHQLSTPTQGPPYTPAAPSVAVSAAVLPGSGMSGRLSGVLSLTDVLNLYARASGLKPEDPEELRRRRRTSSSSSVRSSSIRASLDGSSRPSVELSKGYEKVRGSTELGRPPHP